MAIENLQKSEGIATHKSSLLNSHVSQPGSLFDTEISHNGGGDALTACIDGLLLLPSLNQHKPYLQICLN